MNRPTICCHMVTSLDGKVTGDFLSASACENAVAVYYEINRRLKCDGYICGRITMEGSFTGGWYPDLSSYAPIEGECEDFLPDKQELTGFYAVAFDPKGKLGWQSAFIEDEDDGYGGAQIVEVLTAQADKRYLAYLKRLHIPYIFAGETKIDVEAALIKLSALFDAQTLLLEGGSILNGAFARAGVIDELSLVIAPITADKGDKPLLFDSTPAAYTLSDSVVYDGGVVWLRYRKA